MKTTDTAATEDSVTAGRPRPCDGSTAPTPGQTPAATSAPDPDSVPAPAPAPVRPRRSGGNRDHDHADELFQSHIGGAAMLEGVMMRGRYSWAVAVREPDGGIYVEEHNVPGYGKRQPWRRWPLVRGCVSLVESLMLQFKAMGIVADHAYDFDEPEDEGAGVTEGLADNPQRSDSPRTTQQKGAADEEEEGGLAGWMAVSMVIGVVLGVALFIFVPALVTNLVVGDYSGQNMVLWNVVDGILRAAIFVLYMWLISLMPDIKRMFGYHGAEHKTIHCLEHGLALTPENARGFSRQHVRCGTAFIIMTLIVSIIVFTVFPTDALASALGLGEGIGRFCVVLLSRIVLVPVVAGLSYEITVRWAGSHPDNPLVKIVLAPGMAMQLITTNEPDDGMLECAIASMKAVIAREAAEEGRELDADGLPVDRSALEGCPLDPAEGHGRGRGGEPGNPAARAE